MDDILKKRLQILGLRIAYFRKRRGLTQEQLADKAGMSWSYLAKIEANNSDTPHAISLSEDSVKQRLKRLRDRLREGLNDDS